MKNAIFGDKFFENYCRIEKENEDLKFRIKMLELQLSTLKKKNQDSSYEELLKFVVSQLWVEFGELVIEQDRVSSGLGRIIELLKTLNCSFK